MYNHWNDASGAMLSHLVGSRAAQDVPAPPRMVKAAVSDMSRIPRKRKIFEKMLFGVIVSSFDD
jgi:hypothetical protein